MEMIILHNLLSQENTISNSSTVKKGTLIPADHLRKNKLKPVRKNLSDVFVNNITTRDWPVICHFCRIDAFRIKVIHVELIVESSRPLVKKFLNCINHKFTSYLPRVLKEFSRITTRT